MKKLKSFTLVEMLIVMGIVIILMAVGIITARFAIRRSNRIFHMDAADKLERALVEYKNSNKYVPVIASVLPTGSGCTVPSCYEFDFFTQALGPGDEGVLLDYLEEGSFDGGNDATYYYTTDSVGQAFLVCVSFGGLGDENEQGYYCTGTGMGSLPEDNPITKNITEYSEDPNSDYGKINTDYIDDSDWIKDQGFRDN
jgi:type II secretory pathway pseudopilin PulG